MPESVGKTKAILYLYENLLRGSKLNTNDACQILEKKGINLSKRTVQRYFEELSRLIEGLICRGNGNSKELFLPREFRPVHAPISIQSSELLSLHILKAHLKAFRGTKIEKNMESLVNNIEKHAPGDVFVSESLFWDQNNGNFDYSNYNDIIIEAMNAIIDEAMYKIKYAARNNFKIIEGVPLKIYAYSGLLYLLMWIPKYDNYISLSINKIISISTSNKFIDKIKPFDADKFMKNRFGVYNDKPRNVELQIRKGEEFLFENRSWHPSQKLEKKNGKLIMKLRVPIVPDFTGWIMSWGNKIKVIAPLELITKISMMHKNAAAQYNNDENDDDKHI
ncbi:MAG: helix-turn-helix transcriptional regulator [Candidatus Kapaibacterium sp.]